MGYRWKQNKRKNFIIIIILIFVIISVILISSLPQKTSYPNNLSVNIKENYYYLEVAQSNQQRKIGLSNRNEICPNCGMIFTFDKNEKHSFWMKDTYIPLDIIWLNPQKQIVKIINAAPIDSETIYTNQDPAQYVIELPANETLKLNLQIGDTIPIFD